MPGPNAPYTNLDYEQVIKQSFDESQDRLRVDAEVTAVIGAVECIITDTTDSIKIGNGSGVFAGVDSNHNLTVIDTAANTTLSSIDLKLGTGIPVTQSTSPWIISGNINASQSGTWTVQQGNAPWSVSQSGTWTTGRTWTLLNTTDSVNSVQSGTWNIGTVTTLTSITNPVAVTQSTSPWVISGTVTANAGINLNTSLLALDTSVNGILVAQGSTTSGQTGPLVQTATTTNAPTYTTAKTNPISTDTSGNIRVSLKDSPTNTNKFLVTADAITFASPQHVIVDSGTISATQSGTWTVQQGSAPWSVSQSGTWNLNNISGVISLPTGASTSANQATEIASLSSIDGKLADNYGVATGALRTASQIGNTTGAADFNAGTTGAQTLRTATNINGSSTATVSLVAVAATNTTVLASNANRRMAIFFNNNTGGNVFLKFGTTATTTSFTVMLANNAFYEMPSPIYTGQVDGISGGGSRSINVTEY